MAQKTSKNRINLEVNLMQTKEALRESDRRFKELAELLPQTVFEMDLNGNLTFVNKKAFDHFGYAPEDFNQGANAFDMIVSEEHYRAIDNISKLLKGKKIGNNKYTALRKNKSTFPAQFYSEAIFRKGNPVGVRGIIIDITERVILEKELQKANETLEFRVKERTSELREANKHLKREVFQRVQITKELLAKEKELERKNIELKELNSALKVLLKKRDEDKKQLGEKVINNINELVLPYLEKLRKDRNKSNQSTYIDIIESNLKEIISPFGSNLSRKYLNLTPTEIRIADLIKSGKRTKEIAAMLNLSSKTIEFHRGNIRIKLQIKNKKISLRAHLLSMH
jgi:PAS domain S-box-containing protein